LVTNGSKRCKIATEFKHRLYALVNNVNGLNLLAANKYDFFVANKYDPFSQYFVLWNALFERSNLTFP
jgi:hypothetical protein